MLDVDLVSDVKDCPLLSCDEDCVSFFEGVGPPEDSDAVEVFSCSVACVECCADFDCAAELCCEFFRKCPKVVLAGEVEIPAVGDFFDLCDCCAFILLDNINNFLNSVFSDFSSL